MLVFEDLQKAIASATNTPPPLWVKSPLDRSKLESPVGNTLNIVLRGPLDASDARALGAFASRHARVSLCLSSFGDLNDLTILEHFPGLNEFHLRRFEFDNFEQLKLLPESLDSLSIAQTKSKRMSLSFLARHSKLRKLSIESHTKDLEAIGSLADLRDLTLRSITLPNLQILTTLKRLKALDIKLGGTKCISELPAIGALQYLELWMIKGMSDLSAIAEVQSLRQLHLEDLKNVVSMPSLKRLTNLRRASLLGMKGLTDLTSVADAPNLVELHVGGKLELDVKDFAPFKNHKALKFASVGVGATKRNAAIERYLGLPSVQGPSATRREAVL